ncbi:MAG: hypothetical protein LBO72_08800 [Helicobacteraceae bacterium]|jgi:hypothetical protein|nr:hypothetical protein [Helicobacteraceae bacterium]
MKTLAKIATIAAVLAVCAIGAATETPIENLSKERTILLDNEGKYLTPMNVNELSRYDFSPLFGELEYCEASERIYGCYLAYIGDNYQRLHIVFDEIKKIAPLKYAAKGQTMVKGNYCDFSGEITIDKAYRYKEFTKEYDGELIDQGVAFAEVILRENDKQKGSGVFTGDLMTKWYIDANRTLQYDDIEDFADGYANNQFLGVWTSYKTSAQKRVAWGHGRIPLSLGFDTGTGEFAVNPKYIKNGWEQHGSLNEVNWSKK